MKKYRVREGSPLDHAIKFLIVCALVLLISAPSAIEALL